MKTFFSLLLVLVTIFIISSCKKDTTVPLDFSKITVTDSLGLYVSDIDTTDWTYDANWTDKEAAFLLFADAIPVADSLTGYVQISPAYPNPNGGAFKLSINTERDCKMKLVCVNTAMQILFYTSRKFTGGPVETSYDFSSNTAFHKNANYRLYYGFYNSKDSLYYKGHGDFRVE